MRTWLEKLRVSLALDADEPRRGKPCDNNASEEIKECEKSMRDLDRRLKAARLATPVPTALHASVMRAVRAVADSKERQSAPWFLRWLPAPALAMLLALGLWLSLGRSPHESPSLTAAAAALERGHEMAQKAPEVVLAPLSQEMDNLNRDLKNAVDFLVASVP